MIGVILAAGRSSRLNKNCHKSLCDFYGLPVIERILREFKKAGIDEIIVVTGYRGEEIENWLEKNNRRLGIKYRTVKNNKWDIYDNAYSLLCVEGLIKDRFFILSMGDHIVDSEIIKGLKNKRIKEGIVLAVDTSPYRHIDVNESTKVVIKNNRIVDIGKDIEEWDGIDTGVFKMNSSIFSYIKDALKRKRSRLSEVLKLYLKENKLIPLKINGKFWIDVDTEEDFKRGWLGFYRLLVKKSDGPVSRYINRKISVPISSFLSRIKPSPNILSFFSFLLTSSAALLFAARINILGAILTQMGSIADGIDGEIARLLYKESKWGEVFDNILDRTGDFLIIGGITFPLLLEVSNPMVLLLSLSTVFLILLPSFLSLLYKKLKNSPPPSYLLIDTRDVRLFLIFLFMLFNRPIELFITLNLLITTNTVRRLIYYRKLLKKT